MTESRTQPPNPEQIILDAAQATLTVVKASVAEVQNSAYLLASAIGNAQSTLDRLDMMLTQLAALNEPPMPVPPMPPWPEPEPLPLPEPLPEQGPGPELPPEPEPFPYRR